MMANVAGPRRRVVRLEGQAVAEVVQRGTASEHEGVVLETAAGERLRLVRLGGNPFSDPETRSLVGRKVALKGYRVGDELRFLEAREVK